MDTKMVFFAIVAIIVIIGAAYYLHQQNEQEIKLHCPIPDSYPKNCSFNQTPWIDIGPNQNI